MQTIQFDIQFFAEGAGAAAGGEGEGTAGVHSADAGQTAADSFGIPENKRAVFERSRARRGNSQTAGEGNTHSAERTGADSEEDKPTGVNAADAGQSAETPRPTWDEILRDPEYKQQFDKQVSGIVRNRMSKTTANEDRLRQLEPLVSMLTAQYGIKEDDLEGLTKAVTTDKRLYEKKAAEMGVDVDTAMRVTNAEAEAQRASAAQRNMEMQQQMQRHFASLKAESEEIRKLYPEYDFDAELNGDERVVLWTSPRGRMTMKEAFYAKHGEELLKRRNAEEQQKAVQQVTDTIRAGQSRPKENGTAAPAQISKPLYSQMSKEERAAALKYMKQEAAKGRAVSYFNR